MGPILIVLSLTQVNSLKTRLSKLRETAMRNFGQDFADKIPSPDDINMDKLDGGSCMTDNLCQHG